MIILDFDGVLIDSIDEVAAVTYHSLTGISTLIASDLPHSFLTHFKANRFHAQPASDFLALGRWCLKRPDDGEVTILARHEWEQLLLKEKTSEPERRDLFFASRSQLCVHDVQRWQNMMQPFQPLWQVLQHTPAHQYLILTNKNRQAVSDICTYHQLKIDSNRIYSGDDGLSKAEQLQTIKVEHRDNHYFFIDDSIYNLLEILQSLGPDNDFDLALAVWGYVGANDRTQATRSHIALFEQWDLIEVIEQEAK